MPQALPSPEHYAEQLQNKFKGQAFEVLETIRLFTTTHVQENLDSWDLNIYFDQVKYALNEINPKNTI